MSYNYLAWDPDVVITPVYMKKPASGTSAISGGALLKAGTPLNNSKAVANTSNAKFIVAEDYIFYTDPVHNTDPVKLISSGYVDLAKAQAAFGKSYTEDAIAALADAGIILVDGATLPSGGGSELPEVTADDNGDVLTVVEGEWAKAAPSGGGALIVGINMMTMTLDKTWQEIHDALPLVYVDITEGGAGSVDYAPITSAIHSGIFYFVAMVTYSSEGIGIFEFSTDSADGYPVYSGNGGEY